jgi:hypothetical protein
MTDTSEKCSWLGCSNKDGKSLMKCARCGKAKYCQRSCQKLHWKMHKYTCVPATSPIHRIGADSCIQTVQAIIDQAGEGDAIELKEGTYGAPGEKLVITKALTITGAGMEKVSLRCLLRVEGGGGKLVISNLKIDGRVDVQNNSYEIITFLSVEVACPPQQATEDAFFIGPGVGKFLLLCCEIVGGSDGLFIDSGKVHIKDTDIQMARSRGIFANKSFVIEDSAVYNCGAYGIKGRGGWSEKGDNTIQSGPWSSHGGASGMF